MSSPRIATFSLTETFTPEMDAIRLEGFPPKDNATTLKDSYDEEGKSVHLLLKIDNEVAVYHRFTNNLGGKKSVIQDWTNNQAPTPNEPFMDMGRFVIGKKFRASNPLFTCFILMGLMYAREQGFEKTVTLIKDERALIKRCEQLGFEVQGKPVPCDVPHFGTIHGRLLTFDLVKKGPNLQGQFDVAAALLLKQNKIQLNWDFLGPKAKIRARL